jgi:ketosteroid isomerase-like protein
MTTRMDTTAATAAYFDAWRRKDLDLLRSVLADDVTFTGSLGTADGAEACVAGVRGLSEITTDVEVEHVFADGPDVLTWFTLHTTVAEPTPVANWSHVEDGRITRIRVTFDPRGMLAGPGGR